MTFYFILLITFDRIIVTLQRCDVAKPLCPCSILFGTRDAPNDSFSYYFLIKYHKRNCFINFQCQFIGKVNNPKYFAVILYENRNQDSHILELHRKVRSNITTFYFLRHFVKSNFYDLFTTLLLTLGHNLQFLVVSELKL